MIPKGEILAPAGDFEKLRYALEFGADAVYAGQPQFSLRARENGFKGPADIENAIAYCHAKNKKFYLTSNIIPRNNKLRPFFESLSHYATFKPDAMIVSDPGVIRYLQERHPEIELHLSVQANCTNWSSAQYWYEQGIKRIILSRELNIREITEIHAQVPLVELEVFVHGAICMAHSGRCLLSNYMQHRDSNQGMCNNACRYPYQIYVNNQPQSEDYIPLEGEFFLKNKENAGDDLIPIDEDEYGTYIMNAKDMCAIENLDRLCDAGVISFKIEGRTKSLFYLAQTARAYRGALNDVQAGRPISPGWVQEIMKLSNRGYTPGPFAGPRLNPQNHESSTVKSDTAEVAAWVRGWDKDSQRVLVDIKGAFSPGDKLELITPSSVKAIEAKELKNVKGMDVERLHSGMKDCSLYLDEDPGEFAYFVLQK